MLDELRCGKCNIEASAVGKISKIAYNLLKYFLSDVFSGSARALWSMFGFFGREVV